nr:hypothetical protein L203_01497 [Cryptococcus depauperatus CBS 7841]
MQVQTEIQIWKRCTLNESVAMPKDTGLPISSFPIQRSIIQGITLDATFLPVLLAIDSSWVEYDGQKLPEEVIPHGGISGWIVDALNGVLVLAWTYNEKN